MLERGAKHPSTKVRNLADRAHQSLRRLRLALDEDAGRDKLRQDVADLERKLAAAKARLHPPRPTSPASSSSGSSGSPCPKGCGRLLVPQGASRHIAACKGAVK